MEDVVMTNDELALWRLIGADMGYEFDELGHPYRRGVNYEIDGHPYQRLHDWRPLEDDGDAFRLMMHYGLSLEMCPGVAYVRTRPAGPILHMEFYPEGALDALELARKAFFAGAALIVKNKSV